MAREPLAGQGRREGSGLATAWFSIYWDFLFFNIKPLLPESSVSENLATLAFFTNKERSESRD
jgi:hypothetical protein